MSLSVYNKKRHFSDTPEPEGKEKQGKGSLRFVVQKHDASHLHYDFRLEMDGVLKSWAVPKGPSLNPKDKRLAMMVEDHPYDYRTFEGSIPDGNYGAGVVMVWDEGTYEPGGMIGKSKKEQEKSLLKQLSEGTISFVLYGKKLKGAYALVKMKGRGEKTWILIKKNDEEASEQDVTQKDQSAKTGKTLEQIAKGSNQTLNHPEKKQATVTKPVKQSTAKKPAAASKKGDKKNVFNLKEIVSNEALVTKMPMPQEVKPMLATLVEAPFNGKDWLYEIKWDGYRAVSYLSNDTVNIISRNNKPFTEKYYTITDALKVLDINAVLDGEIVAVDEKGLADFQSLQNWQNSPQVKLQYFVFDIVWYNGYDVSKLPLIERKQLLQHLLPADNEIIKYSDHVLEKGKDFFKVAVKQGLEGIMAKKINSTYEEDSRTDNWLKIKVVQRQEVVIAGFTAPRNTRKFFGALLLGIYENGALRYIGHSGSGFNRKSLEMIWNKLQPLVTTQCPFAEAPKTNMPATWVAPKLVCEIKFSEWTNEKQARHPIFMGLREDKNPKDVKMEKSTTGPKPEKEKGNKMPSSAAGAKTKPKDTKKKNATDTTGLQLSIDNGKDQTIVINTQELKLTNLNKIYWKKEGYAKIDMINYYLKIAPYILPYLKDRPQSLNRYPNGISGMHFYQKDVRGKVPEWTQKFEFFSESNDETIDYLVCSNEATMIYMANLGCIEMHPWHSRIQSADNPDYCLIDLDPDKKNPFDQVMEVAHIVKKILDAVGVNCYCKTSGSTGLHIYIPLGAKYTFEQSKQLAQLVVTLVHNEVPEYTSLERNPDKRKGKIYLDFLQNRQSQTVAAPYSLRPKPGAPVSAPLHWDEIKKGLTSTSYNISNIWDRLKAEGDLFKPVLSEGIDLTETLKKIETQFS